MYGHTEHKHRFAAMKEVNRIVVPTVVLLLLESPEQSLYVHRYTRLYTVLLMVIMSPLPQQCYVTFLQDPF